MAHIIEEFANYHKNLTKEEVVSIREDYLSGATQKYLAESFAVSLKTIYKIIHVIDYKHVPVDEFYMTKLSERLGK